MLVRDEFSRYAPNPAKPPKAMHVDGTIYHYTREAWQETTQQERTTGEIHTMTMEVERYLGDRSRDELLIVLEIFVDDLAGFGKESGGRCTRGRCGHSCAGSWSGRQPMRAVLGCCTS